MSFELTEDESKKRLGRLSLNAQEAAQLRDWCKQPGYLIFKRLVDEKILDKKQHWLRAKSAEEAETIRLQTQPWQEVYDLISKRITEGDASALLLRKQTQDSEQE